MAIIDGRAVAQGIKDKLKEKVSALDKKPGLAVVLVGDDPASGSYVGMKEKACKEIGFYSEKHYFDSDVTEEKLLSLVNELNANSKINGILVQLPLPKHIDEHKILLAIDPKKDVDGFHPESMGKMMAGQKSLLPATPKGIITLIESTGVDISGKNAVVIGRSNIVGKPVAMLLLSKNATVTVAHSRTQDLPSLCKEADIIVAAVGKLNLVTEDMVKEGAIVIDVGTNRVNDDSDRGYHWEGDVDFENVKDKCSFITPVPGGVGPMTIASLMENTLQAYNEG